MSVLRDGEVVGVVSSGNFSPILEHGIALAFVDPSLELGDKVQLEARGAALDGVLTPLPFVAKH
jgi:aminomethyltransferase